MGVGLQRFEDMQVWQDAQDFAVSIYEITRAYPDTERYALTDQIRRASTSISANIAEGYGRKSRKDMLHFYNIAHGSLLETKNFIYLSFRLDYIDESAKASLLESAEVLQRQLKAIARYFNTRDEAKN